MRVFLPVLFGGLLTFGLGRPLGAQQPLAWDVGVAAAYFPADKATAAGPYIRLSGATARTHAFGAVDAGAIASVGSASGFGTLRAGVRTGVTPGWNTSLEGELGSVAGSNQGGAAGTGIGSARATWSTISAGSWLRAQGHASARANTTLKGVGVDVGAWWSAPMLQVTAQMSHEWTRAELFVGRFREGYAGTAPVRYTEAAVSLHRAADRLAMDVSAAVRRDPDAARLWEASVSATAAWWTGARTALVVSAAHQLPDWIRGADATNAVSVSVRFRQASPATARAHRVLAVVHVSDGGEQRVLRVRAAGARHVEVMGDFTEWTPLALVRAGDLFEGTVRVAAGSHRMMIRLDGGEWRPAVNTPVVDDDLGGKVGLLVVP